MRRSGSALTADALTHRWLVLLAVAAGVAASVAVVMALTPSRYDATSIVGFTPNVQEGRDTIGGDVLRVVVPEYVAAATSSDVLSAAEKAAGAPPGALDPKDVSAQLVPDTATVSLVVSAEDPQRAVLLADGVASALVGEADDGLLAARVVRTAEEPERPAAPARALYDTAGVIGGLGLGLALVLTLEAWRPRVRTTRHLSAVLRAPTIAHLTPRPDVPLGNEALRIARLRLTRPPPTLDVTAGGSSRSEGVAVVGAGRVEQSTVTWVGQGLVESFEAAGRSAEVLDVAVPPGDLSGLDADRRASREVLPQVGDAGGRDAVCVVPVVDGTGSGALDVAHAQTRALVVVRQGEREATVAALRTQLRAVGVELVGGVLVR